MEPLKKETVDARRPCVEILDEAIVEVLRGKTVTERVAMVFDANHTLQRMLEAHLRWKHPEWDAAQVLVEITRRRNRESV